jgi:hypothetical protein
MSFLKSNVHNKNNTKIINIEKYKNFTRCSMLNSIRQKNLFATELTRTITFVSLQI